MPGKNISISIVIPTYNGKALLAKNLPAVLQAARGNEVIVVDDASSDNTVSWLRSHYPKVRVVGLPRNRRFAHACNEGVKHAKGDVIVLLNSDVVPRGDFLNPIFHHFLNKGVFAVGCREISYQNGKEVISGRAGGAFVRGLLVHWRAKKQEAGMSLWASGGSAAFLKRLWIDMGGMDEHFAPAYEEDRDLCYRALKRGYEVRYEPKSEVVHEHETTNITSIGKQKMMMSSYKNQLLMVWKNVTSQRLLITHFLWLPYHMTVTAWRSRGLFWGGMLWALGQLPAILSERRDEKKFVRLTDESILAHTQTL